jgi:hypothetical protein
MSSDWYIRGIDGAERGPISSEKLEHLALEARITPETPLKKGASGSWGPAGRVKGLFPPTAQPHTLSDAELESAMDEALGHAVVTPAPPPPRPAAPEPPPLHDSPEVTLDAEVASWLDGMPGSPSSPSRENSFRPCPFCGEEILKAAKKCKHCGEWLQAPSGTARSEVGGRGATTARAIPKAVKEKQPSSASAGCGCLAILLTSLVLAFIFCKPGDENQKSPTKSEVAVYAAEEEVICATGASFLDSSPLLSPANFIRVPAGTELIVCGFGNVFHGRLYWELTSDGTNRIYVYDDILKDKFRAVHKAK